MMADREWLEYILYSTFCGSSWRSNHSYRHTERSILAVTMEKQRRNLFRRKDLRCWVRLLWDIISSIELFTCYFAIKGRTPHSATVPTMIFVGIAI